MALNVLIHFGVLKSDSGSIHNVHRGLCDANPTWRYLKFVLFKGCIQILCSSVQVKVVSLQWPYSVHWFETSHAARVTCLGWILYVMIWFILSAFYKKGKAVWTHMTVFANYLMSPDMQEVENSAPMWNKCSAINHSVLLHYVIFIFLRNPPSCFLLLQIYRRRWVSLCVWSSSSALTKHIYVLCFFYTQNALLSKQCDAECWAFLNLTQKIICLVFQRASLSPANPKLLFDEPKSSSIL